MGCVRAQCCRYLCTAGEMLCDWLMSPILSSDWPVVDAACCSAGKSSAVRPLQRPSHRHQRPHAAGEGTRARHREDTGQLCLATAELAIVTSLWEIIFAEIPAMLAHCKMILDADIISSCQLKRGFSESELVSNCVTLCLLSAVKFYGVKIPSRHSV